VHVFLEELEWSHSMEFVYKLFLHSKIVVLQEPLEWTAVTDEKTGKVYW
jgi:hypothetical protein